METTINPSERYEAIRQQLGSHLDTEAQLRGFAYELVLDADTLRSLRFGLVIFRKAAADVPGAWEPSPGTSWVFQHTPKDLWMSRMSDTDITAAALLVRQLAKQFSQFKIQIHPRKKSERIADGYLYANIWF